MNSFFLSTCDIFYVTIETEPIPSPLVIQLSNLLPCYWLLSFNLCSNSFKLGILLDSHVLILSLRDVLKVFTGLCQQMHWVHLLQGHFTCTGEISANNLEIIKYLNFLHFFLSLIDSIVAIFHFIHLYLKYIFYFFELCDSLPFYRFISKISFYIFEQSI